MDGGDVEKLNSVFMMPGSWSSIPINKHITSCSAAEAPSLWAGEPFFEGLLCVSLYTKAQGVQTDHRPPQTTRWEKRQEESPCYLSARHQHRGYGSPLAPPHEPFTRTFCEAVPHPLTSE